MIKDYKFFLHKLERIELNSGKIISGTKDDVKEQITKLATEFDLNEIMTSCTADSAADRKRSFRLPAEAFELN